jgi:hypothetical protein
MSLDRYVRGFGPSFVLVDDLFAILHNQLLIASAAPRASSFGYLQCLQCLQCITSLSGSPAKSASKVERNK